MRIPTEDDFYSLRNWGMIEDPFIAINDYSDEKEEQRWENERHCQAHEEYKNTQSAAFVNNPQEYYVNLERPIDRTKWEYLKLRKSWFHPPAGWNKFSAPGISRILDLGCGDGDLTQRIADHIAANWLRTGYDGFPMEIVGIDLNESRIKNAQQHTESPHRKITLQFHTGDALETLDYVDSYFDYTVLAGVVEIMNEDQCSMLLDEVERLTARGIYIRDLLDEYPGFSPRHDLEERLHSRGFACNFHEKLLEEPFTEEGSKDPLEIWPMNENQVIFAENTDPSSVENRYGIAKKLCEYIRWQSFKKTTFFNIHSIDN